MQVVALPAGDGFTLPLALMLARAASDAQLSVPIRVRVVLVGPPDLYAALLDGDPDFAALFRVKVEIEPSIPRTTENLRALDAYAFQPPSLQQPAALPAAAASASASASTRMARPPTGCPCRPANNTSAGIKRPPTSAPPRCCWP